MTKKIWRYVAVCLACAPLIAIAAQFTTHTTCTFDRNELGPMGTYGQWWWEIYKCSDGTERRELVAGPRG